MESPAQQKELISARTDATAAVITETGLSEDVLRLLVHRFYAKVRDDEMLGPIFAARITNWAPHLERMVAFWSSVALMTGQYHGRPVPAHVSLPIDASHFQRWLALFRAIAHETCTLAGAAYVIERAERIAQSLHFAVVDAQTPPSMPPKLV
jgi:hemoglobin